MSAAAEALNELRLAGGDAVLAGDGEIKIRTPSSLPADRKKQLKERLTAVKLELLALLTPPAPLMEEEAADLLERFHERAAIRQFDAHYTRQQAELMAWNEVAFVWYREHGQRTPPHLCAGCGRPLGTKAADVLLLPFGEHAHADPEYACVIRYGQRWKRQAATALAAIGITPPKGVLDAGEDE
jgi:hypothetical protein